MDTGRIGLFNMLACINERKNIIKRYHERSLLIIFTYYHILYCVAFIQSIVLNASWLVYSRRTSMRDNSAILEVQKKHYQSENAQRTGDIQI